MKSIISIWAICSILVITSLNSQAQTEGMEIGLRFSSTSVGVDFAMPLLLNSKRLHANASFLNRGFSLTGFYDWQFPFADGFFMYAGPGTKVGIQSNVVDLAIGGEIGFEYQFIFPLTIGIDYEPMLKITNSIGYVDNWNLNARWRLSHLLNYRKHTR